MPDDTQPVSFTMRDAERMGRCVVAYEHSVMPSLPKRTINIPPQWNIIPMIVVETQKFNQDIGIGQNVDIDSTYTGFGQDKAENYTFDAKPYDLGAVTIADLTGDVVKVACRMIPSVMFTGQLFLFASVGQYFDNGKIHADGDVVSVSGGPTWIGYVTTEIQTAITSPVYGLVYVDVQYNQKLPNQRSSGNDAFGVSRNFSCRVLATNNTGIQLTNGQQVTMEYTSGGPNAVYPRWLITDYKCNATN